MSPTPASAVTSPNVCWFSELGLADLEQVGGKNSSLGEMISQLAGLGVSVPGGFATTADAYRHFIGDTGLAETISARLAGLDTDDVTALAQAGLEIRADVVAQPFPPDLEADIRAAYTDLSASFAVRSSATAEDLPDALRRSAGDVPQRPRHRCGSYRYPGGVRLPLQRPGHRLPRSPRLRP